MNRVLSDESPSRWRGMTYASKCYGVHHNWRLLAQRGSIVACEPRRKPMRSLLFIAALLALGGAVALVIAAFLK